MIVEITSADQDNGPPTRTPSRIPVVSPAKRERRRRLGTCSAAVSREPTGSSTGHASLASGDKVSWPEQRRVISLGSREAAAEQLPHPLHRSRFAGDTPGFGIESRGILSRRGTGRKRGKRRLWPTRARIMNKKKDLSQTELFITQLPKYHCPSCKSLLDFVTSKM
jgi:hypothetical protein